MLFVGVDGEMSGTDIEKGHRLIQIGLSVMTDRGLESISFFIRPRNGMVWSEESAKIHNIPIETLIQHGLDEGIVDGALYDWLLLHGANPKQRAKNIPVGFNIIGFDMPFIKMQLPKTYSLFSRRMADLNGMLWLLHGKNNKDMDSWKKMALDYAEINLPDFNPHDAEWDAKRHLLCFEYLRSVILNG